MNSKSGRGQSRKSLRVACYVRVSSDEQVEGFSLDAQERAIEAYCQEQGYEIVGRYRDEGKSARTNDLAKRPAFQRMLTHAEEGRFDALVVHKLDRFSRNLRVTLETLDTLERAGVGFTSISESIDFTTAMGRVVLSTMGSLAQFYSDNLSNETKKGKQERKAQGFYNGLLPFGAAKGKDGVPIPDPANHAGLVLAFSLAASGSTDREIAKALNEAGYRTTGNRGANPFTKDTVRPMLQNRFYLGFLPDGSGGWLEGRHGSLINEDLFLQAETSRARNTSRPRRVAGQRTPWALSGLAVCTCGATFIAHGRGPGKRGLRCSGRAQGSGCDASYVMEDALDAQLAEDILAKFQLPEEEQARLVSLWLASQGQAPDVRAQRESVERRLQRLREVYLDEGMDRAEYQRRRTILFKEREALPAESSSNEEVAREIAKYLANLPTAWRHATPDEKNRIARQLFAQALIDNKMVVAVKPRPEMLPFFEGVYGGSDGIRTRGLSLDRAAC